MCVKLAREFPSSYSSRSLLRLASQPLLSHLSLCYFQSVKILAINSWNRREFLLEKIDQSVKTILCNKFSSKADIRRNVHFIKADALTEAIRQRLCTEKSHQQYRWYTAGLPGTSAHLTA